MNDEPELICYIDGDNGYYKFFAPPKGAIVTQAFIFCKRCGTAIYPCTGPKPDAICIPCYEKEMSYER